MPLPDQTPKLPKLPFLVGDAALLVTAWFVANRAPAPWTVETILVVAGCVLSGALLGAIPFVADYARKQDEALDDRQRGLDALARTVAASAEQISIAAQGLHEIAELAQGNLKLAEKLPQKLQEKFEELRAQMAAVPASTEIMAAAHAVETPEKAVSVAGEANLPEGDAARAVERPASEGEFAAPAPAAKVPRKPRSPRKPKVEEVPAKIDETPDLQPELPVFPVASPSEFSQLAPDETTPDAAVSSDGVTRLLVTAYIGIGNRLFIRGDGPGLSWEKGVPLQFVSIGKWRWETADAAAPVRFKLFKNDEVECVAPGECSLEVGSLQEITASF